MGLSSECGESCIPSWLLLLLPGEPSGAAQGDFKPWGGQQEAVGEATVARAVRLRVFLRAGACVWWGSAAGAGGGWCGLLGYQSKTGDRVLPRSGVMEQKATKEKKENRAESTVPVALPCPDQGLTAPGPGCVCGAGQKDTHPPPHLPARECCVLLHRALRDGNTM